MKARLTVRIVFLLGICQGVRAQNVNGHWFGVGVVQTQKEYNNYMSELVLRQKGRAVWGWMNYYFKDSLVKAEVSGSFDEQSHRLRIKPFAMIYYLSESARNSIDCNMSGEFVLTASKTGSVLSGTLESDRDHRRTTPDISYRLTQSNDTLDIVRPQPEAEPTEQAEPARAAVAAPPTGEAVAEEQPSYQQRTKLITKELEVDNSSLRIEIYDNGQIDYDSVSLYLNDKRILAKSMLTHRAIRMTIQLDPSTAFSDLTMFAENLGLIPPNTAALVIYDGTKRYETLLSSDLSKSATIRLRKKIIK